MRALHLLAYLLFNSKVGFATEEELRTFKITTFAKRAGVPEQVAEFMILRRKIYAKLRGETDWRKFYD